MDILDEIDAAIQEKRSKWKYTPMREKSETDAIIDDLLREFSSGSSKAEKSRQQSYSGYSGNRQETSYAKKEPASMNDEQRERYEYNASVKNSGSELKNSPDFYIPPEEDDDDEYNEYVSQKYSQMEYDDDEYPDEEYDDEFPELPESGQMSRGDFDRFMDSENDGERGDLPKFSVAAIIKTILKIVILAAFGAFAVVGIINTASTGLSKLDKSSASSASDTKKKELESVIYPLIVTEIKDFSDISELTDEDFVNIGTWELVINGKKSVFKDDNTDEYLLPQDQMDYIIEKLFGQDAKFKHTTAGIGDAAVVYDEKNKQYIIPENTDLYTYYPVVTDVSDTGDSCTVYADCYASAPSWNSEKQDPVKRVMITLNKTSEYYNIVSMKTIPVE